MATEKRLIDMDYTMDKLRVYADRKHAAGHNEIANGILKAVSYIRNDLVRVDAVEVVRCKDCEFVEACSIREAMECTDENGFCWRAERRRENGCP